MGKVVMVVVLILMLLAFAGPISDGIHTWRVDEVTQVVAVTTGAGVTIADVVLTRELFNAEVTQITAVTSSITETPIVGTYVEATKTLSLSNLTAAQTRTLTLVYSSEKEDTYLKIIGPFLTILIFGGIIGAIIYNAVGKKR